MEKKAEPRKATSAKGDIPPIQSKEVLLLHHDYSREFAKRKVESNWDRYAELSDDEDNPQMMAAKFDKILLAPKSIGEHFTFSAERAWEQVADADAESNADSQSNDLFKLNMQNLKNGIGQLPFYLRNDLPLDLFIDDEITDMNFRAKYYENNEKQKTQAKSAGDPEHGAKHLIAEENLQRNEKKSHEDFIGVKTHSKTNIQLAANITKLAESTVSFTSQTTSPTQSQGTKTNAKPMGSIESGDIQDWLDDILNDK